MNFNLLWLIWYDIVVTTELLELYKSWKTETCSNEWKGTVKIPKRVHTVSDTTEELLICFLLYQK